MVAFPEDTYADTPTEVLAEALAEAPTNPVVEAMVMTQESYGKKEIVETPENDTQTSTSFWNEPVFHYPEIVPVESMKPHYSGKVLVESTKPASTFDYSGPAFWELPTCRYSEQAFDGSETTDSADTARHHRTQDTPIHRRQHRQITPVFSVLE